MIPKTATICFTGFVLIGVLVAFDSPAFAQGNPARRERQSQETAARAESLFQNSLLLHDNQNGASASAQLQEAMRLWIQIGQPGKAAMAALQAGDHYNKARQYQGALARYRLALDVKPLAGAVKTSALNSIALTYAGLYLHDLAARYFNQALREARVINDRPAQILALAGLADLYRKQGADLYRHQDALKKARSNITSALKLSQRDHAADDPALLYLNGQISREQGQFENARGAFEKALAIYQKTGNVAGRVRVLCELSALSLLVSQNQAAFEQAEQAVQLATTHEKRAVGLFDRVSAREWRWPALLNRARAERALGQKGRALKSFAAAISDTTVAWWTVYIATDASAVGFREALQSTYREYVDLLIEEGQSKTAYDFVERAKGRTLLTFTGARRAKQPSVENEQAVVLRDLNRSIALRRVHLLASGLSRDQRAKLQKEMEDADFKMDEIRFDAEMKHSNDRLVWSDTATGDKVQEKIAKDQMTLAEFSLGEKRSFLWLFTRGEVFVEILPPRKEIEDAVRPYLDLVGAPPNPLSIERDLTKLRERSGALFARLFGSLSRRIEPGQRLIVVPDGLLHYLPFETLIHDGHYLVEDHEISYLPSASILLQLQNSRSDVETGDRMELLAFGDPTFSPELKAPNRRKRKSSPTNLVRNAQATRGFALQQLPRTNDEVKSIAGLFPAGRARLYLGKDSTEDAVKRESLLRYRRLHFATHSVIDENAPSRSAVVLAQDNNTDEDGYLEVNEISELDLDCDLVVLSACQTGRGQLLSGEGILGLSRAFLYAGARAIVVSFWNVSDISTSQLMKSFYQHITAGMGNAAALRATKLQMLKSDRETRHPYYWAPFVIIGKP